MRPRCAATYATSSQSNSSVSSTIAGMPRPRNKHSATMSCRLSSTITSATPNAYWRTCPMRCNHTRIRLAVMHCSLVSFCLWHQKDVWPAAPQCWKKCGAATVRVSVLLYSRFNASSKNGISGSSSSGFALLFLLRHPVLLQSSSCHRRRPRSCCNHSHRETGKSVWMCADNAQQLSLPEEAIVAPSVTRQHTKCRQRHQPEVQIHSCRALCNYSCVWVSVGEAAKRRSTGRHIRTARGTTGWQRYMRYGPDLNNHARWRHTQKSTKQNTAAGCGCVCVALRVSARPGSKKTKQEGKKCVLRPTGPRRTPTRRGPSSCVQQARRTGPSS
ncbi:hypothetical protein ECC02_011893 [Trypanosoma cruzi]|uniref:Uncharacterized protein n=1 Tax=Trypanosoma cruzi TaxID=5693 RepID=A0A7J6XMK6_TRYCR|nr:hypothetical protein ECC02_011893 [Trypanosoma cruzi]